MDGHFMRFRQLVQKWERMIPITSTLQGKQNWRSFYGFCQLVQKLGWVAKKLFLTCTCRTRVISDEFGFFLGIGRILRWKLCLVLVPGQGLGVLHVERIWKAIHSFFRWRSRKLRHHNSPSGNTRHCGGRQFLGSQ